MDGNKDDAVRCLKIGQQALDVGDQARALKFIEKARRLDPNLPIDDLLSKIDNSADHHNHRQNDHTNSAAPPRRRAVSSSSANSASSYSEEQVAIVREIKKKKDYYQVLGVERSSSVEDIRKAYRKLSLKVHPDKNKAPGAEDAFKLVSKSFKCLSDEGDRRKYDLVGPEEEAVERRAARNHQYSSSSRGFYDGEVDAEEIFRNFFFGGGMQPANGMSQFGGFSFGPGGVRVRMGNHRNDNTTGGNGSNIRALIQLLPIIFILLFSFLPSSQPVYSLSRSYPYENLVTTTHRGVNFYVNSVEKFEQQYPYGSNGRGALELKIEREYYATLTQNCQIERQRLQWGFIKEAPHCDALKRFQASS